MGLVDYEHFVVNKFGSVVLLNNPNWNMVSKWVGTDPRSPKMDLARAGPNPNPNPQKGVPPLGWDYQSQSELEHTEVSVPNPATKGKHLLA